MPVGSLWCRCSKSRAIKRTRLLFLSRHLSFVHLQSTSAEIVRSPNNSLIQLCFHPRRHFYSLLHSFLMTKCQRDFIATQVLQAGDRTANNIESGYKSAKGKYNYLKILTSINHMTYCLKLLLNTLECLLPFQGAWFRSQCSFCKRKRQKASCRRVVLLVQHTTAQ